MAVNAMQAMLKARLTAKTMQDGDYILPNQTGRVLVHELTIFETDAGTFSAIHGEIVSSSPKVTGGPVQPPGTKIRSTFVCNGKYANVGWEHLVKLVSALFDLQGSDEGEYLATSNLVFGADGLSKNATAAERADPFFAARGLLVDFSSGINAKSAEKRKLAGKETITQINWKFVAEGNTIEEITVRAAKLPPLSL